MALADLRALARVPIAGTRGNRGPASTGPAATAAETQAIRGVQGGGTRGTREIGKGGGEVRAASGTFPAGTFDALDAAADQTAIAPTERPGPPPVATEPPPEQVSRLALALSAPRPWQRVTDPAKARGYFWGEALRRLALLEGQARELLVVAEEAEARRWAAAGVTLGAQ